MRCEAVNYRSAWLYVQLIGFGSIVSSGRDKQDGILDRGKHVVVQRMHWQAEAGGGSQVVGEHFTDLAVGGENARVGVYPEVAGPAINRLRLGKECDFRHI